MDAFDRRALFGTAAWELTVPFGYDSNEIERMKRALVNADSAGDVEAARALAQAIREGQSMQKLRFSNVASAEGYTDAKSRIFELIDGRPERIESVVRAYANEPWFRYQASPDAGQVAESIAQKFRDLSLQKKGEAWNKLWEALALIFGAPLGFFFGGLTVRWIVRGFSTA